MATFGIVMLGIIGGSLLLMVAVYVVLRLVGWLFIGVFWMVELMARLLGRAAGYGGHALLDALRRPAQARRHRHRPA